MGGRASEYAQTLIEVSRAHDDQIKMAMNLVAKGKGLYRRIVNILNAEQVQ